MDSRAEADDETAHKRRQFHPDNLGRVFGKLLAVSVISFWLSLILLVVVLLASSEENPTLTATDFPVFVSIGSWVGIWVALLGYSGWSFWQLRRMRDDRSRPNRRNPLRRVAYLILLLFKDIDESSAYEKRLQRGLQTLLFGLFVSMGIPVGIVHG